MKKYIYIIFLLTSCFEVKKNLVNNSVKYIVIKDYNVQDKIDPILIFYNTSHNVDTNYYNWSFEILTNTNTLNNIYEESKIFKNNLTDTSYKNLFHLEVYDENENKIENIELPMEKRVEYFDLLIKILKENKIKELDIAVKKLNYMKD